jgi:hypothetical protein
VIDSGPLPLHLPLSRLRHNCYRGLEYVCLSDNSALPLCRHHVSPFDLKLYIVLFRNHHRLSTMVLDPLPNKVVILFINHGTTLCLDPRMVKKVSLKLTWMISKWKLAFSTSSLRHWWSEHLLLITHGAG